jgi:hypothetical protein
VFNFDFIVKAILFCVIINVANFDSLKGARVRVMVFNATFNSISVILFKGGLYEPTLENQNEDFGQ